MNIELPAYSLIDSIIYRQDKNKQKYNLMTSVATPVFDLKNYSVSAINLAHILLANYPD
jgi:hypothetical protein